MEKFKYTLVIIVVLLMFGCSTQTPKNDDKSSIYKGRPIKEIIMRWGDPVKTYVGSNGNKVYVYYNVDIGSVKDRDASEKLHKRYSYGHQYITKVDVCTRYFETDDNGIIVDYRHEGIGCR